MSHLNLETLARLVDDAPDPTEAGHLDLCEQCRSELESLRADAVALGNLSDPEPPIAAWLSLEQRLKREGLIRRGSWTSGVLRTAAMLSVFVLGSIVGGLVMRHQRAPVMAALEPRTSAPVHTVARETTPLDTQETLVATPVAAAVAPSLRPAATMEEASTRLRDAEQAYVSALARYSEFAARRDDNNGNPVARLAALESIVATTRAALGQAPADPVINGYHLTAVAQRDATLRQIAASKQQTWY